MTVSPDLRLAVRTRAAFACEYCGVTEADTGGELTIDHFRPRAYDGSNDPDNLLYRCHSCNTFKADYWPLPGEPTLWNPRESSVAAHFLLLANGALSAEVVEDEQRHGAHQLEALVVGHLAGGAEGRAQVVEQVRHDREEHPLIAVEGLVGGRGRQVRLADAARPEEQQPAARLAGEVQRAQVGLAQPGDIRVEGKVGSLTAELQEQITALTGEQLFRLSEALFDFTSIDDVTAWLAQQAPAPAE